MIKSKAKCQLSHAKRRLYERYEIALNEQQILSLVKMIQDNKIRFIVRQSNRLTAVEIPFQERKLIAICDSNRKTIVTFLPEGTPDDRVGDPSCGVEL